MYLLIVWHAFSKLTSFQCVFLGFTCLFIKNSMWSSKCARFQFLFQPNMVVRGPRKWLIKFLLLLSLWGGAQLKVQQKIPPYRWGYNGTLSKSFGWRCPPHSLSVYMINHSSVFHRWMCPSFHLMVSGTHPQKGQGRRAT